MRTIIIQIGKHKIQAQLRETKTADVIYTQLPFQSFTQTWGNEVYFSTPVNKINLEDDAKQIVELGEIAFWVEGNCIAIGFGPTPISHADEIRLAAKTNIWADTNYDLLTLKDITPGDVVKVIAAKN